MNVYLGELYKEVEYIQSNGTQYINTGYIPSNTTKIQISMGGWTYVQQYAHLFGVRAAWNTTDASIGRGFLLCHQYNTSYIGMFGRGYSNNSGGWSSTKFSFANGNNHIIEMSQSGVYEDGTLKASLQTVTFTSPSNMCIFALNDNGTVKENSSYKLYYFKIWNNGTLVRDFVPCYRVSDNVIGLFDKVNNKFYTNAGTGTFTKGNDVKVFQSELKNAYIGEYTGWKPGANTVMYYPFKNDQLDKVGSSSIPITGTKQTIGYRFTSSATVNLSTPPTSCRFVSVWMKYISSQGNCSQTSSTYIGGVLYNFAHINSSYLKRFQYHSSSTSSEILARYPVSNQANINANQWYHLAYGTDGTKIYAYLNGDKIWETNPTPGLYTNTAMTLMQSMDCEMSEFIGESVCWTQQEVLDYYNQTKSNYGL